MNNPTADEQVIEIKLASGETCRTTRAEAIHHLKELHEWYSGQEKEWFEKTYRSEYSFNTGYEREWRRYCNEAAALQLAINILSGDPS